MERVATEEYGVFKWCFFFVALHVITHLKFSSFKLEFFNIVTTETTRISSYPKRPRRDTCYKHREGLSTQF